MKHPLAFLLTAATLPITGCMVGPDYARPTAPVSATYKEASLVEAKDTGPWQVAHPNDGRPRTNWWEVFGDPKLNKLEEQVATSNQDLKSAEARFRAARAMVGFATAAELPIIGAGASLSSVQESANRPYSPSPVASATGDFQLPIDLDYEVDLWGRVRRNVNAAGEEAQATAADVETVSLSLHAELALDYFNLRSADARKKLLDATVASYTAALQLVSDRNAGGAASGAEVEQARTQLNTVQAQDTDISIQRAQFEHAIATLIGKPPAEFGLPPDPLDLQPPDIPIGLPSQLLERRPDIAAAERRMAAANEQIGIAEAAYYPTVTLNGLTGFEGSSTANWFSWPSLVWAVGVSITETVFDGGRRRAQSDTALAGYDATVADYRQEVLNAFQQVEDNIAALRLLQQERQQQHVAVTSAETSLVLFTNRYVGGKDIYLQVITAQTVSLANQLGEVDIQQRQLDASVLLVKALGGDWRAADLPQLDQITGKTPRL